jgi:hypothetical protein
MHFVTIADQDFAAGLFWQSARERLGGRAIRGLADELGLDAYIARHGDISQIGFCRMAELEGHKKPLSLAAALAGAKADSWRVALNLGTQWWYGAVDDGVIQPDGDEYGAREDITKRLSADRDRDDIEILIQEDQDKALDWLEMTLDGVNIKACRIRPIPTPARMARAGAPIAIGVLIIAMAAGGWHWYAHKQAMQAQQAARTAAIAKARAERERKQRLAAEKQRPKIPPWERQMLPARWLDQCQRMWRQTRLSDHGWRLRKFVCNSQYVTVTRSRDKGVVTATAPMDGRLTFDGDALTQTRHMTAAPPADTTQDQHPLTADKLNRRLHSLMQLFEWGGAIRAIKPSGESQDAKPAPYQKWIVSLEMTVPPFVYRHQFAQLPTLRFGKLTWQSNQWSLEGVIYVNN